MNRRNPFQLQHSPSDMVVQNLSNIKDCVDCMLDLCHNNEEAEELILNHAWMVDHISTASDDLRESCDFMCHQLGESGPGEEIENPFMVQMNHPAFESYDYHSIRMVTEALTRSQIEEIQYALVDRYGESAVGPTGVDGRLGKNTFNAIMQAISDAGYKPGAALTRRKLEAELEGREVETLEGMSEDELEWWIENLGQERFFSPSGFFSKNVDGSPWIIDGEKPIKQFNWKWYFSIIGEMMFDSGITIVLESTQSINNVDAPQDTVSVAPVSEEDDKGYRRVSDWNKTPPINPQTPRECTREELQKYLDDFNRMNADPNSVMTSNINPRLIEEQLSEMTLPALPGATVSTSKEPENTKPKRKRKGLFRRLLLGKKVETNKNKNESVSFRQTDPKRIDRFRF